MLNPHPEEDYYEWLDELERQKQEEEDAKFFDALSEYDELNEKSRLVHGIRVIRQS